MQTGDVLVAVNGTSVVGLPLRNVTALFKQGTEGTETTLTLLRPTDRLS
jgi:C-terminal processing protease CtpA/Prc